MRKAILLLMTLLLFLCPACAEEEEDWVLSDAIGELDPELASDIYIDRHEHTVFLRSRY